MSVSTWLASFNRYRQSWLALIAALLLVTGLQKLTQNKSEIEAINLISDTAVDAQPSKFLKSVPKVGSIHNLPPELQKLFQKNQFGQLRSELLDDAMAAVEEGNDAALASNIALLGLSALEEEDLDSAGVYLNEALDLYEELDDELGAASVSLHLGRMHIIERRRARRAALAYDTSLLARWKIAHGQFEDATDSLRNSIAENLNLNRHGAAAIDFESLYRGYLKQGNIFDAETAALHAARLHAGSGRVDVANNLLKELQDQSVLSRDVTEYNDEIAALYDEYESSVNMLAQARDYTQLYNHFIAKKDPVRAWRFRLKADAAQQLATKRARYRRQADVLVLLYNSNDSMRRANSSLDRARSIFDKQNQPELARQSAQLLQEVF